MVLRRGLRALRFAFARVALIILSSEAWTLLSDNLSLVIFRQSNVELAEAFSSNRSCMLTLIQSDPIGMVQRI